MRYLIIAALLLAVSGCAYIEQRPATAMLTVQYATLKYVGEDRAKAERVRQTAAQFRDSLSGDLVTLDALDAALRAEIKWDKIDQADQLLLNALLLELRTTLEQRFSAELLSPDDTVVLRRVADWIIQAAR